VFRSVPYCSPTVLHLPNLSAERSVPGGRRTPCRQDDVAEDEERKGCRVVRWKETRPGRSSCLGWQNRRVAGPRALRHGRAAGGVQQWMQQQWGLQTAIGMRSGTAALGPPIDGAFSDNRRRKWQANLCSVELMLPHLLRAGRVLVAVESLASESQSGDGYSESAAP
jgi:hypothetical protein